MYRIVDSKGHVIGYASRRTDAQAMAQKTSNESEKKVDKVPD